MKKFVLSILAFIFLFSCASQSDEVVIGAIFPLTGDYSSMGESYLSALEIAAEQANVKFIVENEGSCDVKSALTAAQKLVTIDKVDFLIGPVCLITFNAVLPFAEENNIAMFGPSVDQTIIDEQSETYKNVAVGLYPAFHKTWYQLAEEAYKKGKKIAVLQTVDEGPERNVAKFTDKYEELGGDIILHERVDAGTKDFRTLLLKLDNLAKKKSGLIIWPHLARDDRILFYKQKDELNVLQGAYLLGDLFIDLELQPFLDALGEETLEGVISTTYKDAMSEEFKKALKNKFNVDPVLGTDNVYDAVVHGSEISKDCNKNSECIISRFKNTDYAGVSGKLEFDETGNRVGTVVTRILNNGTFVIKN